MSFCPKLWRKSGYLLQGFRALSRAIFLSIVLASAPLPGLPLMWCSPPPPPQRCQDIQDPKAFTHQKAAQHTSSVPRCHDYLSRDVESSLHPDTKTSLLWYPVASEGVAGFGVSLLEHSSDATSYACFLHLQITRVPPPTPKLSKRSQKISSREPRGRRGGFWVPAP